MSKCLAGVQGTSVCTSLLPYQMATVRGEQRNVLGCFVLVPRCNTGKGTSYLRLGCVTSVCVHYMIGVGGRSSFAWP